MAASTGKKSDNGLRREAPPALIAVALLLVLAGVGAGIFYFVNGGWKTEGQKMDSFYHEFLPLEQYSRGNKDLLIKENELRKKEGRELLVPPASKAGN